MVDLAPLAKQLADGIVDALPRWVERSVDRVYRQAYATPPPPDVADAARRAGKAAAHAIGPALRDLLGRDIDEQTSTPLTVVRGAVRYPTSVLRAANVPELVRDARDQVMFAEDVYGLTPANFADIDPGLADAGIAWGAAKAWTHRRRHQP